MSSKHCSAVLYSAKELAKMAASRPHLVTECKQNSLEKVTSHSVRPMSFTAVKETEIKTDCLQIRNENEGHYNFFSCDGQMDANASETCYIPTQPLKLSDTNPFKVDVERGCWADVRCKEPCSHIYHPGSCTLAINCHCGNSKYKPLYFCLCRGFHS